MRYMVGQYVVPMITYKEDLPSPGIDAGKLYVVTNEMANGDVWICPAGHDGQEFGARTNEMRPASDEEVRLLKVLFT